MSYFTHAFETQIVSHHVGLYDYTVVFLAPDLISELPLKQYPRLRISGEIGNIPIEAAWQPVRGRWFLMLSKQLMRDGGFSIGDTVEVRFLVVDQDAVDVPNELADLLATNASVRVAWDKLSAGKRRALAHRVSSAKTAPTRARRIAEIADAVFNPDYFKPKTRKRTK